MSDATDGDQYHFDPVTYLEMIREEVPAYDAFQDAVAAATAGVGVERVLELGVGTGQTSQRVLDLHPAAELIGIDESAEMLAAAAAHVPAADLRVHRLEEPLPEGPFDLIVSALAVHHLDGAGKAELFSRIAERLRPDGRFVLGDVVVPRGPSRRRDADRWGLRQAEHGGRAARVARRGRVLGPGCVAAPGSRRDRRRSGR